MRFKSRPELLSHSSEDRTFVERLADVLRAHGVPIWYSDANIVGARMWHDEIGAALRRCDWFVLVLSPDAGCRELLRIWGIGYAYIEPTAE